MKIVRGVVYIMMACLAWNAVVIVVFNYIMGESNNGWVIFARTFCMTAPAFFIGDFVARMQDKLES